MKDVVKCSCGINVKYYVSHNTTRRPPWPMKRIDTKVLASFFIKSDIYFTVESGRGISCRERKPGECCEQKRITSHCLDLHD